jgi:glycosyltransferase involved in cell wall biosynthesis
VSPPLVLHVLPVDLSRGAQVYARELRIGLDGAEARHRTVTLFRSSGALAPDHALGVAPGRLRRVGFDPRALARLRRLIRTERPAVVVAHGSEPLKYAVLAGVPRARIVNYKIGAGHTRLTGLHRWIYRSLLSRAGMVATVSQAAAAEARELGVAPARLRVIPNGRDPKAYPPRATAPDGGEPATTVRLVWVGHLDEAKRPLRFVDLVGALRDDERLQRLEIGAAMAGDGPLLDRVRARGAEFGIDVLGNVADVAALLAASDVLVLTSAPNEGMPGVLIEAGLTGLPVVATDVPGARDVIDDGATGFVVAVDDFDALVRATGLLVGDPALRARLGAAARLRCQEQFSLEASMRGWRTLLAEIAGRAREASGDGLPVSRRTTAP